MTPLRLPAKPSKVSRLLVCKPDFILDLPCAVPPPAVNPPERLVEFAFQMRLMFPPVSSRPLKSAMRGREGKSEEENGKSEEPVKEAK